MKKLYILADIHANLEALRAVQNDIQKQRAAPGVSDIEIVCLGDVVGYGPSPFCCTQWVEKNCSLCVRGNHEQGFIQPYYANVTFNPVALLQINRQREMLQKTKLGPETQALSWMMGLSTIYTDPHKKFLYVHGSIAREEGEAYFDVYVVDDFTRVAFMVQMHRGFPTIKQGFYGHVHRPASHIMEVTPKEILWHGTASQAIFSDYEITEGSKTTPGCRFTWRAKEHAHFKGIHCPGSVGKTRMEDPGYAHFMVLDFMENGDIRFEHKVVPYQFEKFLQWFQSVFSEYNGEIVDPDEYTLRLLKAYKSGC